MEETTSTRAQSKILLEDQLALKFVALRLSSLDDLVESLNRLIKSIKLFQLLFGTSYCSSTDILLFLRFSLLSLKTVADKFTQTFCGVDNQIVITNIELKKILEEIHDYIVKGGNRLNDITMLPIQYMPKAMRKWKQSMQLQYWIEKLLLKFSKIYNQEYQKRKLQMDQMNQKECRKQEVRQKSVPEIRRPGHIRKIIREPQSNQISDEYGMRQRQTPKIKLKEKGCLSLGKLFTRLWQRNEKQ